MSTSATVHLPHLDGWRGLAILLVLLGHFAGGMVWLGPFGVALFFVLSGRLMGQLLFIKQVPLTTFFFRRASRILPAFWLFVIAMYIYAGWFQKDPYQASAGELLATMTFFRTYLPGEAGSIFTRAWPIGHLWSLNVEEHSYIFLGLGALLCRRLDRPMVTKLFLSASVLFVTMLNAYYIVSPPAGTSPAYIRSEVASLGILSGAALWYWRERGGAAWLGRLPAFIPVLTFLVAMLCMWKFPIRGIDRIVVPLGLAVSVVLIDRLPAAVLAVLAWRPLRWLGVCSFSLYLWQQPPFVALLKGEISPLPALMVGLAAGTLSYYAFENPLREMINSWWARRHPAPGPVLRGAQ